jgi:hypothetical protein
MQDSITTPNPSRVQPQSGQRHHENNQYSYGLARKLYLLRKVGVMRPRQPGLASLRSLLLGCLSDLRTCLFRMAKRVGTLPSVYSAELGPALQRDATGHLQANTRTHGCIECIRSFEASHPEATVFDVEVFRQGWETGARWVENTTCTTAQDRTA